MHTRNALYGDQILPIGKNEALPTLRQKRQRGPAGYKPAAGAVHPAMLASLQSMASEEMTVISIADMAAEMCESLERRLRRKLTLSDVTALPSVTESAEPKSPQPAYRSPAPPKPRNGNGRWNPLKRIAKSTRGFAKLSPSPNRDRAERIGHSPLPSTPTRLLFSSPRRPKLSPSKAESPTSKGSPLRVFTSAEPEPATPTTVEAQREESSNLQRARPLPRGRLSLASQLKESTIVDEKPAEEKEPVEEVKTAEIDTALEDSVVQQTKSQDLRSLDVNFGEKTKRRLSEPVRLWSTPELSVDARTNLDIFGKSLTAVSSLAKAAEGFKAAAVDESNVIVERSGGRLVVRFKLPATYAHHFTITEVPTTSSPSQSAEEAQVETETKSSPAVNEDTSAATVDDGDQTLNIWETPMKAPPSAFTTPRITLTRPSEAEEVDDASFMSTDTDAFIGGLPDTPTAIVLNGNSTPVRAPMVKEPETSTMTPTASKRAVTPLSTATDNVAGANNTEDVSYMANNTDDLIASLPDTPTAIVLGDIQTPRPASITAFSTPALPGSAVSNASVMSTDTDQLIAGLPDTPTAIVLGGEPETPQNRGQAHSDVYEGDYSDLYTPVADQTLAVDIPSSWIVQSSPQQLEQGDSDVVAKDAKSSESPPSSHSTITGPDTAHRDTVEQSSTHNRGSFITPDAGHKASPTSAFDKNATSKASEEHADIDATDTATPKVSTEVVTDKDDGDILAKAASEVNASTSPASEVVADASAGTAPIDTAINDTEANVDGPSPQPTPTATIDDKDDQIVKSTESPEANASLSPASGGHAEAAVAPSESVDTTKDSEVDDEVSTQAVEIVDAHEDEQIGGEEMSPDGVVIEPASDVHTKGSVEKGSEASAPQVDDPANESDALTSPPTTPKAPPHLANHAMTPSPKNSQSPATLDTLLESPFQPSSAGTPKPTTPPSRALEHQGAPCEPREDGGAAPAAGHKANFAETQEAANRAYLGKFLTQHKASKAARSAGQGTGASAAMSTGSPKPRVPLGKIDANTTSPMKAAAKRKAEDEDEETAEVAKPPTKRGRKGSVLKPTTDPEPLRRSSRVKAKVQEPSTENSKIPVRVGSSAFEGAATGGETKEADLASVTRANTRRNKGKAIPPAEVLARRNQDPTAHRMQELKEVHDARAARAGKARGKGIQWGENTEMIFDPEDEEEEEAEEAPAKKGRAKKAAKGSEKPAKKATGAKKAEPKTRPATPKARPATPIKRQTRSSTRQKQVTGGL